MTTKPLVCPNCGHKTLRRVYAAGDGVYRCASCGAIGRYMGLVQDQSLTRIEQLVDENAALRAELEDYRETYRRVLAEACAPDERHCTCVPALRMEIERLQQAAARAGRLHQAAQSFYRAMCGSGLDYPTISQARIALEAALEEYQDGQPAREVTHER